MIQKKHTFVLYVKMKSIMENSGYSFKTVWTSFQKI